MTDPVTAQGAEQADLLDINNSHSRPAQGAPWYWRGVLSEDHQGPACERKDEMVQKKIIPRATYEGIKYKVVAKQK